MFVNWLRRSVVALDLNSAELHEIASHYEAPRETWVRANMVISQDGHFVGPNNTSRDLTGPADLKLLLLLRALSDVVLVGANTARQENYRQPRLRPEFEFLGRKAPRLAVVSESLKFDLTTDLFHGGNERTIIINIGSTEPSQELAQIAQVVSIAKNANLGAAIISELTQLGMNTVTCEGGATLLTSLLHADAVDEYDLTTSPVQVGSIAKQSQALPHDWDLVSTAVADDFKFQRFFNKRD
jgi:riboflavin biosynthesis pyrimidine reductase